MKITKEHSVEDRRELWICVGIKVFIIMLIALGFIIFGKQIAFAAEMPKTTVSADKPVLPDITTSPNPDLMPRPDMTPAQDAPEPPHSYDEEKDTDFHQDQCAEMYDYPVPPEPGPYNTEDARDVVDNDVAYNPISLATTDTDALYFDFAELRKFLVKILFNYYAKAPVFEIFHDDTVARPSLMEVVHSLPRYK